MNTQLKEAANRQEIPENYRNPGNANTPPALGPTTRELLSVLSNMEAGIAA